MVSRLFSFTERSEIRPGKLFIRAANCSESEKFQSLVQRNDSPWLVLHDSVCRHFSYYFPRCASALITFASNLEIFPYLWVQGEVIFSEKTKGNIANLEK